MLLPIVMISLATLVQPSLGQDNPGKTGIIPEKIQKEILHKFNAIRSGVKPTARNMLKMVWSESAAENAKQWAAKCRATTTPKKERIVDGVLCGDNRMQSTHPTPWSDIIDVWDRKKSNFKYGTGAIDPRKDIYGYTQIIWHDTFKMGCATAFCPKNEYNFLYVCRFCPAGNYLDEVPTPYKEGPPCADCPDTCENNLCVNTCNFIDSSQDCKVMLTMFSCDSDYVKEMCAASCKCKAVA